MQVTVLLKECQDIQFRCRGNPQISAEDTLTTASTFNSGLINAETVVSEQLVGYVSFQLCMYRKLV